MVWPGYERAARGSWMWESCASDLENWNYGEPNGDGDCVELKCFGNAAIVEGKWNDIPCVQGTVGCACTSAYGETSIPKPFLCEC